MDRPYFTSDASGPFSHCEISILEGSPVALWIPTGVETMTDSVPSYATNVESVAGEPLPTVRVRLQLEPGRLVVVGRAKRHKVPYLDPSYAVTTIVPETRQSVLLSEGKGTDTYVSRAHFMLRAGPGGGIVLTNGVPGLAGGIRPPTNQTTLVSPEARPLLPSEELLIEPGERVVIQLPNRCMICLAAR